VGPAAFYIRKGWILEDQYDLQHPQEEGPDYRQPIDFDQCFLNNTFIKDEENDGASIIEPLPVGNAVSEYVRYA
jgi:hypothetical protein